MFSATIGADSRLFGYAEGLEFEIFGENNGWTSEADRAVRRMTVYDEFRSRSEFVVSFDADRDADADGRLRPLAVTRLVHVDRAVGFTSLPLGRDYHLTYGLETRGSSLLDEQWLAEFADRTEGTTEIATQAKARVATTAAVLATWAAWYERLEVVGSRYMVMAIVPWLYSQYARVGGGAIHTIGELLEDYVGADSLPAEVDLRHADVAVFRRRFEPRFRAHNPEFCVLGEQDLIERLSVTPEMRCM
jgi:hypothetical protein